MQFITYNIGCRSCFQTDGVEHRYGVANATLDDYKNKTEYEVANQLMKWRNEDGHVCAFCGSSSVEVNEVSVNGYKLYDFNRLVEYCSLYRKEMIILKLDKVGTNIKVTRAGSESFLKVGQFVSRALSVMDEVIEETPDSQFAIGEKGSFLMCITGDVFYELPRHWPVIHRLTFAGLTKQEILNEIKVLGKSYGYTI